MLIIVYARNQERAFIDHARTAMLEAHADAKVVVRNSQFYRSDDREPADLIIAQERDQRIIADYREAGVEVLTPPLGGAALAPEAPESPADLIPNHRDGAVTHYPEGPSPQPEIHFDPAAPGGDLTVESKPYQISSEPMRPFVHDSHSDHPKRGRGRPRKERY